MKPHVSAIVIGVRDMDRAKRFYSQGLGWPIHDDYPEWVSFKLGGGSSALGLYPWEKLADDAGVAAEGSGFGGVTLHYIVRTRERVDAVLAEATRGGGKIAKPGTEAWGGYYSYFADPDGHLRKVAAGQGEKQDYAE